MKNIFIEGLPGSGKSTLLTKLSNELSGYQPYREGDISPVELAWCSYMNETQFEKILKKYPQFQEEIKERTVKEDTFYITAYTRILTEMRSFYQDMEAHEIYNGRVDDLCFHDIIMKRYKAFGGEGNLFECSLLQNSIESLMLFYCMEDDEIIGFYKEAYEILRKKNFRMIYLHTEDIRGNLLHIKKERSDEQGNEMWYPLMLNFLVESPYGKVHGYKDLEDVVAHFERRCKLEFRIMEEVIGKDCLIVPAKAYDLEKIIEWVLSG